MQNIILTGDFSIGKSTIIDNYIKYLNKNNISYGGFRTFSILENNEYNVYIIPSSSKLLLDKNYKYHTLIKCDYPLDDTNKIGDRNTKSFNREIFDTVGIEILNNDIKNKKVIVIDEIGYLESNSEKFLNKIYECFQDINKKTVAIARKNGNSFLEKMKMNKNINIIEVTKDNRDYIIDKYLID